MSSLRGRRLVHLTTSDISLALLLGPQLEACAHQGMEVIGISSPGPFVARLEASGISHVPLRHATRSIAPKDDLLALPELYHLFRRLRPDIVHTHNPKPGLYGRLAAWAAGVPAIVNTVHGLYATGEDPAVRRAFIYALERMATSCSHAELLQNVEDLQVMRELRVPATKLVLLGNGVDLVRFHPPRSSEDGARARHSLGIDKSTVAVGTVGRLVWGKGFRELFEAARLLREFRPPITFVVVGPTDPAKADSLTPRDIEEAAAIGNVLFAGHRDDVDHLYAGFDLFVLPSHREGFPRSAMEAAATGLPLVATDIRGCRQVIDHGQNGLLVPVRDAAKLADAIAQLVADPEGRTAMGDRSRQKAETEFDEREVVAKTLATYRRLPRPPAAWIARRSGPIAPSE